MYKKLIVSNIVVISASLLFTVFQISIHIDVSFCALPLSLIFILILAYITYFKLFKSVKLNFIPVVRKMNQYVPFVLLLSFILRRAGEFGTAFWYDVVTVLLWLVASVASYFNLYWLSEKRVYAQNPIFEQAQSKYPPVTRSGLGRVIYEIVDWIDAIIQAVFTVALIQIFVFQLYEIPSESMVPEFLIKDRVVVMKTPSGPKFPLSEIGLPNMRNYKRGNIVVFRNPHYVDDRKSQVRSFVSQLVYMITFTTVNLNVDENGNPKADPLVKRITGMPGEQLMMQDGILYKRTKDDPTFKQVEEDISWAQWNDSALPSEIKSKVRDFPITKKQYATMLEIENNRNVLNLQDAADECSKIASQFLRIRNTIIPDARLTSTEKIPDILLKNEMYIYNLYTKIDQITLKLTSVKGGAEWFQAFMTNWIDEVSLLQGEDGLIDGNLYSDSMYKFNVMNKLCIGRLIVRNAELNMEGVSSLLRNSDSIRKACFEEAEKLNLYAALMNGRNMPVFPANDKDGNHQYIPSHNYFMMGDNRFNSLDMRHSYEDKLISITDKDKYSIKYYSNVDPQYVPDTKILGTTTIRFWPFNRIGIPGNTGASAVAEANKKIIN